MNKQFADNILSLAQKMRFVLYMLQNIVGKGENAWRTRFECVHPKLQCGENYENVATWNITINCVTLLQYF